MKIFITFSGEKSKAIAIALREWLPKVLQATDPWMSEHDIEKGRRWGQEISKALGETNFGIVCLTPDNLTSPWIHFECGALAKSVDESYVWTYLLKLENSDVAEPLGQFQHTKANKEDTRKLMFTINKLLGEKSENNLSESQLNETFDLWWPKLESNIEMVSKTIESTSRRTEQEILEELLDITRSIARTRDESLAEVLTEAKRFALEVARQEAARAASDPLHLTNILRQMT